MVDKSNHQEEKSVEQTPTSTSPPEVETSSPINQEHKLSNKAPIDESEPSANQKVYDSTPHVAYQNVPSADGRGVGTDRYIYEGKFRNPFEAQKTKQDENRYSGQSSTEERSKYSNLPTQLLENWKGRYLKEIENLKQQDEDLSEKIEDLSDEKRETNSLSEERRIQKKIDRLRQEREKSRLKHDQLDKDLDELNKELSERKSQKGKNRSPWHGSDQSDSSEESENITAKSLFRDDDPIQNTVLYVATFFPGLNPEDFKRVVLLLLGSRVKNVTVTETITTEEGKIQVKETQKEKRLAEIWQESFDQPDRYLRSCYLRADRNNGKQGIDFALSNLREDFLTYFEEEEAFYLGEQIRRTQELNLLLDCSNEIAEKAIDIAIKVSVNYPNAYAEDWLIGLLVKIAQEDERRIFPLLERLSTLIYRLQLEPDYLRSEDIAQNFLNRLIAPEYRSLAFAIFQDLMDKHLRFGALGIQSAAQLLGWLRGLLDQESREHKDEQLQADIYSLLEELLWRSGLYLYIYDFLGILKEWLPEQDITPEQYSASNKTALLLLFSYCEETISKLDLKWYGEWPSFYPLFAPFQNQESGEISDEANKKLNILFSWLFHTDKNKELSIYHVLSVFDLGQVNLLEAIGSFIASWLAILFGLNDTEPKQEVVALVECIIRQVISNTSRDQQVQLVDFWASLAEEYLDLGLEHNKIGNRKLKEQLAARRRIIRNFKKQFKAAQKEIKLAK